ncbi:MAG: trigger factor [Lactobacillales bacterium]|jgi:trigger factor|nr:trigger factor [Lactobacillales bacterium]
MTATFEKTATNEGVITFTISDEIKEAALTQAFNKVKKNISVPGFRKGKVTRQMFNKMYGEEVLYDEAINIALNQAYPVAVEEAGVEPVAQPAIDVKSIEKGQPWVFTAAITVKPEVKLGAYKKLEVPKTSTRVLAKDVNARLEREQELQAEIAVKEGKSKKNDTVVIDFEGFVAGVAFEGGKGENHPLVLGSDSFIPGFEDQLIGTKAGDEKDVEVTFPEEYQAEDLAGKAATFKVTVKEVKEKILPTLDDEFAKDVDDSVETLEDLKAKYKEEIKAEKEAAAENAKEEAAIELAVANAEIVELPAVMIDQEATRMVDEQLNQYVQQGISKEMFLQVTGQTEATLLEQAKEAAEKRVKTSLVIEAIVADAKIEVTEADIEAEYKTVAEQYNMPEDQVRKLLAPTVLEHDVKMKKAVDLITTTAKEVAAKKEA